MPKLSDKQKIAGLMQRVEDLEKILLTSVLYNAVLSKKNIVTDAELHEERERLRNLSHD